MNSNSSNYSLIENPFDKFNSNKTFHQVPCESQAKTLGKFVLNLNKNEPQSSALLIGNNPTFEFQTKKNGSISENQLKVIPKSFTYAGLKTLKSMVFNSIQLSNSNVNLPNENKEQIFNNKTNYYNNKVNLNRNLILKQSNSNKTNENGLLNHSLSMNETEIKQLNSIDIQTLKLNLLSMVNLLAYSTSNFRIKHFASSSTLLNHNRLMSLSNYCELCLQCTSNSTVFVQLTGCGCSFCEPCLRKYIEINVREYCNVTNITCPSNNCPHFQFNPNQGNFIDKNQIKQLTDDSTFELYNKLLLDYQVYLDPNKVWCPKPNCETICTINFKLMSDDLCSIEIQNNNDSNVDKNNVKSNLPVYCDKCDFFFCLNCRNDYHENMPCQSQSQNANLNFKFIKTKNKLSSNYSSTTSCQIKFNEDIKKCPKCRVYIERDKGCAQMMCQKCKHVFCWFCLESLEEDFLLRHYDNGPCKNKLGHSRASIFWHRTQIIGIFIGFGLFLLLISPLFLMAAPCCLCYNCCLNFFKSNFNQNNVSSSQANTLESNNLNDQNIELKYEENNYLSQSNANDELISRDKTVENSKQLNLNKQTQHLLNLYLLPQSNSSSKSFLNVTEASKDFVLDNLISLQDYNSSLTGNKNFKKYSFLSLFNWNRTTKSKLPKATTPTVTSSLLDVKQHQLFIDELMDDQLNLDNQLNTIEVNDKYKIVASPNYNKTESIKNWFTWTK